MNEGNKLFRSNVLENFSVLQIPFVHLKITLWLTVVERIFRELPEWDKMMMFAQYLWTSCNPIIFNMRWYKEPSLKQVLERRVSKDWGFRYKLSEPWIRLHTVQFWENSSKYKDFVYSSRSVRVFLKTSIFCTNVISKILQLCYSGNNDKQNRVYMIFD